MVTGILKRGPRHGASKLIPHDFGVVQLKPSFKAVGSTTILTTYKYCLLSLSNWKQAGNNPQVQKQYKCIASTKAISGEMEYLKLRPLLVSNRKSGHLSQDESPLSNFTCSSKGTSISRLSASSGNVGFTVMFHWKTYKQHTLQYKL